MELWDRQSVHSVQRGADCGACVLRARRSSRRAVLVCLGARLLGAYTSAKTWARHQAFLAQRPVGVWLVDRGTVVGCAADVNVIFGSEIERDRKQFC